MCVRNGRCLYGAFIGGGIDELRDYRGRYDRGRYKPSIDPLNRPERTRTAATFAAVLVCFTPRRRRS